MRGHQLSSDATRLEEGAQTEPAVQRGCNVRRNIMPGSSFRARKTAAMATAVPMAGARTTPRMRTYGRAGVHDVRGPLTVKEPIEVGQVDPWNIKP